MYIFVHKIVHVICIYCGELVVDKTRIPTNSKIWPDSTCAISVRRKGQILLVVGILVLSTTNIQPSKLFGPIIKQNIFSSLSSFCFVLRLKPIG